MIKYFYNVNIIIALLLCVSSASATDDLEHVTSVLEPVIEDQYEEAKEYLKNDPTDGTADYHNYKKNYYQDKKQYRRDN